MSKAKEVTQRLTTHINGGAAHASYLYDLHYKGVKIGERVSKRGKKTDPASREAFLISVDGENRLDLKTATPAQTEEWLNQRIEENLIFSMQGNIKKGARIE